MYRNLACAVALALTALAPAAGATEYGIINLTTQYGGDYNWSVINNSGELAGSRGNLLYVQLTTGRVAYRAHPHTRDRVPTVLANDGSVYFMDTDYSTRSWGGGFSRGGDAIAIPSLPNAPSGAIGMVEAINDHGVAAGYGHDASGDLRATIYKDGQVTDISGGLGQGGSFARSINNLGTVAGTFYGDGSSISQGFVYADGQVTWTGRNSWTNEINDQNLVAGERIVSDDAGLYTSAFLFQDGVRTDIGLSGMRDSEVIDLNNANQLLAKASNYDYDSSSDATYFLYVDGQTIMLDDLLAGHGYAGWSVSEAYDINDKGQILVDAGHYVGNQYVEESLLLSPVPEPGTWAMLLAGLGCVGVWQRRRTATA